MDILDMKVVSNTGNRYLLVVVDRATKFLSASPLPTKESVGVSKKLLELNLIFGLPLSIRCDPGTEFTSEVMGHLCRWLKVSLRLRPGQQPKGTRLRREDGSGVGAASLGALPTMAVALG